MRMTPLINSITNQQCQASPKEFQKECLKQIYFEYCEFLSQSKNS
jgi:hypothetical protein